MALTKRVFEIKAEHRIDALWFEVPVGDLAIGEAVFVEDPLGVIGPLEIYADNDLIWLPSAVRLRLSDDYVGKGIVVVAQWRD